MIALFAASLLCSVCVAEERSGLSYLYEPAFCMDYELRGTATQYLPQPGDLFMCSDGKMWAKLGHFSAWTAAPQHSGIVFARPDGSLALLEGGPHNSLECEMLDLVPQLQSYAACERVWIRRRCVPLTCEQSAALTEFAMATKGKHFAFMRLLGQLTIFRCRGPWRTEYFGKPHGLARNSYFCSELVLESCVAAGLLDPERTRPSATYPRDLFYGKSRNAFVNKNLDLSAWEPPARWTLCPGTEPVFKKRFPLLDGDDR